MSEGLLGRLEAAPAHGRGVTFLDGAEPEYVSWRQLHDDAARGAAAMQARGVGPGTRVALLGPTSRSLLTAVRATWLAGAAVIVLPLSPRLGTPDEFRVQTRGRIALGDVTLTVSDPALAPAAQGVDDDPSVVTFAHLEHEARALPADRVETPDDDPDATAILQFTSGSTADPKGVVIPRRCVLDNLDAIAERAPMEPDRRRGRVVGAAVPRHGPRVRDHQRHDHRHRARPRPPDALRVVAEHVDHVDFGLQGDVDGRAQLRLVHRRPLPAQLRGARPLGLPPVGERIGADPPRCHGGAGRRRRRPRAQTEAPCTPGTAWPRRPSPSA